MTSYGGNPTPAGPTVGSVAGSEWLGTLAGSIANTTAPVSTDDYYAFNVSGTGGNLINPISLKFHLAAGSQQQTNFTVYYNVFASTDDTTFTSVATGSNNLNTGSAAMSIPTSADIDLTSLAAAPTYYFRIALGDNSSQNNKISLMQGIQFEVIGPDSSTAFPLTITPNALNPGNYDFSWESQDNKLYDLVSSPDLATNPETWPVWLGHENIAATAPTNTLEDIAGGGDPKRFFVVIEKDTPPPGEE